MKPFQRLSKKGRVESDASLEAVQRKFLSFLNVLETNHEVLKVLADLEEKSHGASPFDIQYLRSSLRDIRSGVREIVESFIILGGERYAPLRERYTSIDRDLECVLPGSQPIEEDDFTIPFDELGREHAPSVGSKNAQLGELKNKLDLPVPDGFAITAWAYKHFVTANNLQNRIGHHFCTLDLMQYDELVKVSEEIRSLLSTSPVPEDLAASILERYSRLSERFPSGRFSLRSSAVGEDTLFSFAGQYASFLNIRHEDLINTYRKVVASKFLPRALYYFLSHALCESDLAISVGCVAMIDSAASGVIYTRNPVDPDDDCLLIYSIYGLGKYLVDGKLTPDLFRVSRKGLLVVDSKTVRKPVRLVLDDEKGIREEHVPKQDQRKPSISTKEILRLAEYALRIEEHYGHPQDIEWAIDQDRNPYLLQSRPLRIVSSKGATTIPDTTHMEVLLSGGTTVCPGAGSGPVFHAGRRKHLSDVPEGAVLVAPHPFPGLVTAMGKARALVARTGSSASHMATLAREYGIPTLVDVEDIDQLPSGRPVTVDATGRVIYDGISPELVEARGSEKALFEDSANLRLLRRVLEIIAPLKLLDPSDPEFRCENSRTFHDITRFAHQKAMEEMFREARGLRDKDCYNLHLKSEIPLPMAIIYLDQATSKLWGKRTVNEDKIDSEPMKAFWGGVREMGWPSEKPEPSKGFLSAFKTSFRGGEQTEFKERSFAILGKEYMMLSLNLGYHFMTIEAMCTPETNKNYIRIQQKGGGASLDRRVRRVRLYSRVLEAAGFDILSTGDYLDAVTSYNTAEVDMQKLRLLGKLTMMAKQLDMALYSDNIADWYTTDFMKKLGLESPTS
ncbi:PEP/pyruvate-binding domain-containing protein [Acidobacteriota bacterium]